MIHIDGIKDEMIANNLTPFRFTHPGEIIKDELEDRGISQREFAQNVGMSYSVPYKTHQNTAAAFRIFAIQRITSLSFRAV